MADFNIAYQRTNAYEGGEVNHWADRGGDTYHGISRVAHPNWPGWVVVDIGRKKGSLDADERRALDRMHLALFREEYWDRLGGNLLSDQDIANEVYDTAVNCGTRRAAEWLQQALNVSNRRGVRWPDLRVDGQIGTATAQAVRTACSVPLHRWLVLQVLETYQRAHYVALATTDATQEENLLGWFRWRIQQTTPAPS